MNQGVSVDEFNGDRKRKDRTPVSSYRFGRRNYKNGPQSFSPGEDAISHRFVNRFRIAIGVR